MYFASFVPVVVHFLAFLAIVCELHLIFFPGVCSVAPVGTKCVVFLGKLLLCLCFSVIFVCIVTKLVFCALFHFVLHYGFADYPP